jgi:HMG-box domain
MTFKGSLPPTRKGRELKWTWRKPEGKVRLTTSKGVADSRVGKCRDVGESNGYCHFSPRLQPKRNLSAYNMFVADHRPEIMAARSVNAAADEPSVDCYEDTTTTGGEQPQTFLRIASDKWKNLDPAVKETYVQLARKEKERYKVELAQWERENGGPKRRRSSTVRSSTCTPPISDEEDRKSPVYSLSSPPVQRTAIVIPKSPEIPDRDEMESCWAPLSCLPFHPSRFNDSALLITPCLEAMLPYHSRRDHFVTMDSPLHHPHSLRGLLSRSSMPDRCDSRVAHSSHHHGPCDWEQLEQYTYQMQAAMQKSNQLCSSRGEKMVHVSNASSSDQSDASNSLVAIVSTEELDSSQLEPLSSKLAHDDFWMVDNDPNFLADNAHLLLSIFD